MRTAMFRCGIGLAVALSVAGCTKAQLESQSTAYAVMDALTASSGATPSQFAGTLASDVLTRVKKTVAGSATAGTVCVPTVFQDSGRVTMHLQLKDPGTADSPTTPSPANTLTFTRYHVNYVRADGRNTPGVDVPYAFDGGMTMSIVGGNVSIGQLTLVRLQAKEEAPLQALINGGGAMVISTIAEVTFYGADQAGRSVSVMGRINVDFADWGDPDC